MNLSVEDILNTYSDHKERLQQLYGQHISEPVKIIFRTLDDAQSYFSILEETLLVERHPSVHSIGHSYRQTVSSNGCFRRNKVSQ